MNMRAIFVATGLLGAILALALTGCGDDDGILDIKEPDPPVGEPMLPDIVPAPPQDAQISHEDGRWLVRFSTILVNIGDGDFVLRAMRGIRDWTVHQDIQYTESGAEVDRTPARLVWGGDGHDHWHVERVAVGRLAPYRADGRPPVTDKNGLADSKIGFCYYDHGRLLDDASQNAVYPQVGCGTHEDTAIGMGLSYGWIDIYGFALPGQSIDVTDAPDGKYRLWVTVDEKRWFREKRHDNNTTWADFELVTRANGARAVRNVKSGPAVNTRS
jgi:hypothetical protein